ncbi:unnamed protein product [Rhizoctonia solani]|uniref:CHAT domain-containing protein n=1 Tax=Rhizoctonia solani TaxID=456999 RepID=A0A8H3I052_9AGAM|nr:unnamed protein product [Rhizoctonia solani]
MSGSSRSGSNPITIRDATENDALAALETPEEDNRVPSKTEEPLLKVDNGPSPRDLDSLGCFHLERYRNLGALDDLNKAIEYLSDAVQLIHAGHSDIPRRLVNVGMSYTDRYRYFGEVKDLELAIDYYSRAVILTPDGHPDMLGWLDHIGIAYADRFECLGELEDLLKSIDHCSRALASTSEDHPDMPCRLANMGICLTDRYLRFGNLEDLEKTIEYRTRSLSLTPSGHPKLASRYEDLGASYDDRFQRLGALEDLEKSVEHRSRAVSLTPDGHPDKTHRLAYLGMAYTQRYRGMGGLENLERSIDYTTQALALTPSGHRHAPRWLASLALAYIDRFGHLSDYEDLEKAIQCESRAVALTPEGHPEMAERLHSLGASYNERFWCWGNVEDIDKAVEYVSRALALTPDDHPDTRIWLSNLALIYTDRFERLGEHEAVNKSIEYHSRALALTPDGHPDLLKFHFNYGLSYLSRYKRTGDPSDLNNTLNSFRKASQLSTGAPRDRFHQALRWTVLISKHSYLHPMEAYQTAIDLLPQYIWFGGTTNHRYQDLSVPGDLAVKASAAAILSSQHSLALEWLEHARCVVWNQSLMLRSPLDQLCTVHPDLATRFHTIADLLHSSDVETLASHKGPYDMVTSEQAGQERRRLAREYQELLSQTRQLPGFQDFLQPIKTNKLVSIARNGPIVVINCHVDRSDALLILPGHYEVQHLPLLGFTGEKAKWARSELESSLMRKKLRERGVKVLGQPVHRECFENILKVLWTDVVEPVLDFLGYISATPGKRPPHITWCPTGALSFLPLHAAGDYSQPRSRVFDYVVSSYTPTLTALLASSPSSLSDSCRVLAIGQAATPGRSPLPGTAKELAYIKGHTQNMAEYTELTNNHATTTAVLDAMEEHDWVHLACHAHQNVKDPTKSGFYLHDATLDLASINRRSFKNKGLAFLSACQTATGDEKLPDEAIHLASGMLMAGYPSVIATMWSVVDEDAPFVADKVYAQLMKDGKFGNGEAGRALHDAVAGLRSKVGEKEFGRWVPYIHIGS